MGERLKGGDIDGDPTFLDLIYQGDNRAFILSPHNSFSIKRRLFLAIYGSLPSFLQFYLLLRIHFLEFLATQFQEKHTGPNEFPKMHYFKRRKTIRNSRNVQQPEFSQTTGTQEEKQVRYPYLTK